MKSGRDLLAEVSMRGWAAGSGCTSLTHLAYILTSAGLGPAKTQRGQAQQVLRPYTEHAAPPNTMSAEVGLGAQPLHTDGAHLRVPPDMVLLFAKEPSPTATRIWTATRGHATNPVPEFARQGVFTVRNGRDSFLASAMEGTRWRFDPTRMSPADDLARETVAFVASLKPSEHTWDEPNSFLLFDNRLCLHGRAAIAEGDENRSLIRRTFKRG